MDELDLLSYHPTPPARSGVRFYGTDRPSIKDASANRKPSGVTQTSGSISMTSFALSRQSFCTPKGSAPQKTTESCWWRPKGQGT